jgi:predicted phage terminase large subunit-like protein
MQNTEYHSEKIQTCRELYLEHGGRDHELIEKKMRDLGYRDFHRRSLYRRFERGTSTPGWIETYGWNYLLKEQEGRAPKAETRAVASVPYAADVEQITSSLPVGFPPPTAPLEDFDEFKHWLKRTWPGMSWEFKHQVYIYKRLKRVFDGDCKRLMMFMPPRHGKSELVTVRFPAYVLKHKPETKIIIGSYNQKLANRFSRKIRSALADDAFLSEPPASAGGRGSAEDQRAVKSSNPAPQCRLSRDAASRNATSTPPAQPGGSDFARRRINTESEWETSASGGVRAVGVGAGVTGYGAHLIIVDDPVKSRAEAESETMRERVWNWFNDDLYTRLEPDGSIILIQTRWHEDDLAGRLLREAAEEEGEQWEVTNLPALSEPPASAGGRDAAEDQCGVEPYNAPPRSSFSRDATSVNATVTPPAHGGGSDPLGRRIGEALWPERFSEAKLARIKRKLGSYSFAALYQQTPVPAEGGLFKRAWFRTVNAAPSNLRWKRGYDLGISTNATADYTASLRVAYDKEGVMYIDGGFRRRIEYPEQRRFILGRIQAEPDTEHGIELSANGNAVVQDLRREPRTRGRPLRGVKVKGDKITRALPWIALAEEGKVFLVRGHWNTEFLDEAASFPQGTHDDQIDAVSIAVRMHREHSYRLYAF